MMVPTGAPAALLLAASEEDEEHAGESWWHRYRWWVLGTVALLAIVGAALALVLTANSKVDVPALTGLTQPQAVARLSRMRVSWPLPVRLPV